VADRYFVNGGVDNNWGTTGNWSTTSGGGGGSSVPTASDAVFFDGSSPNCTVNATNRVCLTFNSTGYTNTITKTFRITVSGAITLGVGTLWAGDEFLQSTTAATHTSNGNTIDRLWLSGAVTHTLADTFSVSSVFRCGVGNNNTVINSSGGSGLTISGSLDCGQAANGNISGTADMTMTGTGTITASTGTGALRNNLTFNTSGTITGPSGIFRYDTGTLTYTAGTVDMTNADLRMSASTTLNLGSAVEFDAVSVTATTTVTNNADLHVSGLGSFGSTNNNVTLNGNKIYLGGGFKNTGTSSAISGTTEIVLNGTGQVSSSSTGFVSVEITIDAGAGTVTMTDTDTVPLRIAAGQLKYLSGTVITDNGTWTTGAGGTGGGSLINSQALVRGFVI
jgi:hypothetical protein